MIYIYISSYNIYIYTRRPPGSPSLDVHLCCVRGGGGGGGGVGRGVITS